MANRIWIVFGLMGLMSGYTAAQRSPATQPFPPGYVDPRPVLEAARKAIGADNLKCVTISGTAYDGAVGQFKSAEKNVDWPRIDALANYTRTMNWEAGTMKEEFDRKPGLNPAVWKYGVGWIDGAPLQQNQHQIFMVNGNYGWYMDGPGSKPVAVPPGIAEIWPIELYLNPPGFLKAAAMPGANPKAVQMFMRTNRRWHGRRDSGVTIAGCRAQGQSCSMNASMRSCSAPADAGSYSGRSGSVNR